MNVGPGSFCLLAELVKYECRNPEVFDAGCMVVFTRMNVGTRKFVISMSGAGSCLCHTFWFVYILVGTLKFRTRILAY